MTMPMYAFGCSCLILIGWLIQTKRISSWVAALTLESFACVCYIVLIIVRPPVLRYIFVTLATACSICIYPIIWPERIRAAHGTTTAGLAIGTTSAAAQLTGESSVHRCVTMTMLTTCYRHCWPRAVSIKIRTQGSSQLCGLDWTLGWCYCRDIMYVVFGAQTRSKRNNGGGGRAK